MTVRAEPVEARLQGPKSGTPIPRWAAAWIVGALLLAVLPLGLSACCAPAGRTGFGTAWFVNDFAQYESAMRQGSLRPDWLIEDAFTPEPHSPAFMFSLYVGIGKAAALLNLPPTQLERLVEVAARVLFLLSVWRFCSRFAPSAGAARIGFLLAVFGGGLGLFAVALGTLVGIPRPYGGNWSYELTTFGLLYAPPHVPLAMAATLDLAGWLRGTARAGPGSLVWGAALGAALALLHPFHVPVLLAAIGLSGLVAWRAGRGPGTLLVAIAAGLGALPALLPTVATFTFDPFWGATYTVQNVLPSPAPHELVVDMGVVLLWAVVSARLRWGTVPPGLVLWGLLALVAMYLPAPYQRRLAFGLHPTLAVLAGVAIAQLAAGPGLLQKALRIGTAILAVSTTLLAAASIASSAVAAAPLNIYRSTHDLDAAIAWLDRQARPGEVILASWDTANYVAPRTPARVFGGHPVATLRATEKQLQVASFFGHGPNLAGARQLGADWLVIEGAPPASPLDATAAFETGSVRIYRVPG